MIVICNFQVLLVLDNYEEHMDDVSTLHVQLLAVFCLLCSISKCDGNVSSPNQASPTLASTAVWAVTALLRSSEFFLPKKELEATEETVKCVTLYYQIYGTTLVSLEAGRICLRNVIQLSKYLGPPLSYSVSYNSMSQQCK